MAADNIAMAVYLTAIMIIPAKNIGAAATPHNHDCTALDRPDLDSTAMQQPGNSSLRFLLSLYNELFVAVLAADTLHAASFFFGVFAAYLPTALSSHVSPPIMSTAAYLSAAPAVSNMPATSSHIMQHSVTSVQPVL